MKNTPATKGPSSPASPLQAVEAFGQLVSAWKEYKITKEVETTKRAQIAAWRDVELTRLDHQRGLLESYLTQTFQERRTVIEGMFNTLDQGIANGDNQLVSMAMQNIISVVQTSPLQGVQKILAQMEDTNSDEPIEI
ncbi:MAG: hypothetical protein MJZ24_09580 [Paludibacteraceae bacterium]|nr:hypothetical protein [Paludibacteraceae bacterium]